MRIIPLAILLLSVVLLAEAQPRRKTTASVIFERATTLYRAGEYKKAAGAFREAYDAEPNTTSLLMAARAYYRDQGIVCVPWQDAATLRLHAIEATRIYDEWIGPRITDQPPPNPFYKP